MPKLPAKAKVTVWPALTVTLVGEMPVMFGKPRMTVNEATLLVTEPEALVSIAK